MDFSLCNFTSKLPSTFAKDLSTEYKSREENKRKTYSLHLFKLLVSPAQDRLPGLTDELSKEGEGEISMARESSGPGEWWHEEGMAWRGIAVASFQEAMWCPR